MGMMDYLRSSYDLDDLKDLVGDLIDDEDLEDEV